LIEENNAAIESIKDKSGKVRALAALARAAAAAGDTKILDSAMKRAFDLGEELFEEYLQIHPTAPILAADAFDELCSVTRTGVRARTEPTLRRVLGISDDLLKAHLLIDAADALHDLDKPQSGARS
jgi:hypothetical protein